MADRTILVVEDDPDDLALILRSLKQFNVRNEITTARDGAEALDYLLRTRPHEGREAVDPVVVLLDLKMPKIDGLEVLRRLREDQRTKLLPVIVLTSSDEEKDIVRSYELGCNSYVRKPVEFREFSEAVNQLGLYWLLLNQPPPNAG